MDNRNLLVAGQSVMRRTKRYLIWFFLLNLALASMGAAVFRINAGSVLDTSLASDRLLHGFDVTVLGDTLARPEVGTTRAMSAPAMDFAIVFFMITLFCLPGVFLGYASDHRLPRTEFFRTCGHNLWRYIRIFIFYLLIAGIPIGILFGIQTAVVKAADKSTNELLPFTLQMILLAVIFLIMMFFRAWFDQAEIEIVLKDQNSVAKTIGPARRRTTLGLWGTYLIISLVAGLLFGLGLVLWHSIVPPTSVLGAFIVGQITLLIWLAARFLQRACAVVFYERQRESVIVEPRPITYPSMSAAPVVGSPS